MQNGPSNPRILCLGRDQSLLLTRCRVLSRRYETTCVFNLEQFFSMADEPFDVIVFCHTLSEEDCEHARTFAHTCWPQAKFLWMKTGVRIYNCNDPEPSMWASEGPAALIHHIESILQPCSPLI